MPALGAGVHAFLCGPSARKDVGGRVIHAFTRLFGALFPAMATNRSETMAKPASERREKLRTALIDAAESIVARDGLAALRARDLAAAAGCALGAIYNAFEDLDAIVFAVNMRTLALLDRSFVESSRRKSTMAGMISGDADLVPLIRLALAYLEFASKNGPRWRALFEHRLPAGQAVPPWYAAELNRIFRFIEEPLRVIRPGLPAPELTQLARTLFSAVHGIVSLGLEEKLGELPARRLREQTAAMITAIARGLRESPSPPRRPD